MEVIEQIKAAVIYLEDNPDIKERLTELFEREFWSDFRYTIINGISNNMQLFRRYACKKFEKYFDVQTAILNTTDKDLLIYFADIGLYAVMSSLNDLTNFIDNSKDMVNEGGKFNVHQIVLSDVQQKLILMVSNNSKEVIEKISRYIRNYLKSDVNIVELPNQTQITISNKDYDSYDNALSAFTDLQEHIYNKGSDMELEKLISMIPRIKKGNCKYSAPCISPIINANSAEDLVKLLAYLPPGMNIQQLIINMGQIGNVGDVGVQHNFIPPVDKKTIARDWIKNNFPMEKEKTTNYYQRYSQNNNAPIHNSQFGKLVAAYGYTTSRNTDNSRSWRKI